MAYKAEHAVDLDTGLILAAPVYHANETDSSTIGPTVSEAQKNLVYADSQADIEEAIADKDTTNTKPLLTWSLPKDYERTLPSQSNQSVVAGRTNRKNSDKPSPTTVAASEATGDELSSGSEARR